MFKLLYKALLISLISGSLTTMNMTAFAQSTSGATYTRDQSGVMSKTETHHFEGTGKDDDNALQVITMLAVGVIGTKLLKYKKWTTDMNIVAIASGVYLFAEIKNILDLKNKLEDMDAALTKKTDGSIDKDQQTQIDVLEDLKASYEEVKKSAESKKSFQKMAATAYMTATGVAIWQRLFEDGQFASCMAAIETGQATLDKCIASGATVLATEEAASCTACMTQVSALMAEIPKTKALTQEAAGKLPSIVLSAEVAAAAVATNSTLASPCVGLTAAGVKTAIQGACGTYSKTKNLNTAFGDFVTTSQNKSSVIEKLLYSKIEAPKMSIDPTSGARSMLQKMVDLFLPKAEAGWVSMLGLGAGVTTAFLTAQNVVGRTIDTYLFTPGGRIIAWGVMWTAANMGAKATGKEIEKIERHIKKIDQILADYKKLKDGIKAANVIITQVSMPAFHAQQEEAIRVNSDPKVRTDCFIGSGNSNCPSISNHLVGMPGFGNLPDSFQTLGSQVAGIGDGLNGTNAISGSTLAAINQYGNNQGAIKKLTDSLKKKLNDSLAKNKQPQMDFDKNEKALLTKLKANTAAALKGSNMSAGSFLASIGLSPVSDAKAAIAAVPAPKKPSSSAAGSIGAPSQEKGLGLDFNEAPAGETGNLAAAAGGTQGDEKFDIGSNDINTNSSESIFQVISNRYIKSGYPRLLEEIAAKE